jgi:KipI family sensor histidine kinase inhibitor
MLRFAGEIGATTFEAVFATLAILRAAPAPGWIDLMPGYASILVVIDPLVTTPAAGARRVRQLLRAARPASTSEETGDAANKPAARKPPAVVPDDLQTPRPPRHLEVPVLYHADVAPDLLALAAEKALPVPALIERHSQPVYRCHMLGFRPGFPFLGGLDPRLATPRLTTPRLSVPAGSVAVAGQQTGIYPSAGPGGWRIIGRTPLVLFDPTRPDPFLVHAGDHVTFVPIDEARFAALAQRAAGAA